MVLKVNNINKHIMKNNKKSPQTIARQNAFIAEFGGTWTESTKATPAFNALCAELIGIDTDAMKQDRIAMESTAQGYRENSDYEGWYKRGNRKDLGIFSNVCGLVSSRNDGSDDDAEKVASVIESRQISEAFDNAEREE